MAIIFDTLQINDLFKFEHDGSCYLCGSTLFTKQDNIKYACYVCHKFWNITLNSAYAIPVKTIEI